MQGNKTKPKRSYVIEGLLLCVASYLLWNMTVPLFKCYGCGTRAYDPDTKANLHNAYLACKAYWYDRGANRVCEINIVKSTTYGYLQSENVKIIVYGNEKTFVGLAYNIKNNKTWKIDSVGTIE